MFSRQLNLIDSLAESCASKAVSYGAVPVLLQMFCDWQRTDHHHRQANIRKAILNVIKNVTMSSKCLWCNSVNYCYILHWSYSNDLKRRLGKISGKISIFLISVLCLLILILSTPNMDAAENAFSQLNIWDALNTVENQFLKPSNFQNFQ